MNIPKIDIIVTQHATIVQLLQERGIVSAETPVVARARAEDVRGKHVLGVLPHHLSSQALTCTEIPIRFTDAEERAAFVGGGISIERLREIAGDPVTYTVSKRWHPAESFPITTEPDPNDDRYEFLVGGDRREGKAFYVDPMLLRMDLDFRSRDYSYFRDGGSWTLTGTMSVYASQYAAGRLRTVIGHSDEAMTIKVGIIAAMEWHDISYHYAPTPAAEARCGRPVAIMQHEPLMFAVDPVGKVTRWRLRLHRWITDGDRGGVSLEYAPDSCTGCSDHWMDEHGARAEPGADGARLVRARCFNEASLHRHMERRLSKLVGVPVELS